MNLLSGEDERRVSSQIAARLLQLSTSLSQKPSEAAQRKTLEEQLPEIRAQLDRMEATGQDTNVKVTALGQVLLHVGKEIEGMRGDLFENSKEKRRFMRKLEETIEQLPAGKQPGEEWYDKPAKAKIKVAIDLLAFVPGMSLKWEKELETSGVSVPKTWAAFKNWFIK
jgi:chaperonin cofactor prefoldin